MPALFSLTRTTMICSLLKDPGSASTPSSFLVHERCFHPKAPKLPVTCQGLQAVDIAEALSYVGIALSEAAYPFPVNTIKLDSEWTVSRRISLEKGASGQHPAEQVAGQESKQPTRPRRLGHRRTPRIKLSTPVPTRTSHSLLVANLGIAARRDSGCLVSSSRSKHNDAS
ncbi:hypothetical protein NMY22_g4884 [Coprinellus aureogranulatus]|nr:hypothetical protein NMY22_g4884 [Coprinellus aureogranulatus]